MASMAMREGAEHVKAEPKLGEISARVGTGQFGDGEFGVSIRGFAIGLPDECL